MKAKEYIPQKPQKRQPTYDIFPIEPGQIRASDIVKWCLENGDLYPLPDDYKCGRVFIDIADGAWFETQHWTSVTKATYARLCIKADSQISRWIKAGMPVREDGRLSYWECDRWWEKYDEKNELRKACGWK